VIQRFLSTILSITPNIYIELRHPELVSESVAT